MRSLVFPACWAKTIVMTAFLAGFRYLCFKPKQESGSEGTCVKRKTTGVEIWGWERGIAQFSHSIKMLSMDKSLGKKLIKPALSGNYHWADSLL